VIAYVKTVYDSRELMFNLASRQIKGQYKKTVFGQLWSLANPLALMLVYTFVFAFVFRISPPPGDPSGVDIFALWLLCGLLPWTFFARSLNVGVMSLVSNEALITKVHFARVVLPISGVAAIAYNFLFEMGVLMVALLIAGAAVYQTIPYLLLALVLLFLFSVGIALLLSIVNVYFRDTEHLVTIALQLWIYLTPVIYPVSLVANQSEKIGALLGTPITLLDIYSVNPMLQFMELFRSILYDVSPPDSITVLLCTSWALVALSAGFFLYSRKDKNLAEAL
jgi:lipopolysaccharide transport system permease protein